MLLPILVLGASLATPTADDARSLLPDMRPWQQPGWTVLSDAPRKSVQQIQRTLERTRQEWDRFLRLMDRPRETTKAPLTCIVFADAKDFEHFAKAHDDLQLSAEKVPGYFSTGNGWIVFLDPGDHADLDRAWADLDAAQIRVDDARREGHGVDDAQLELDAARIELLDHESIRRLALTAHETTHQLVHHTPGFALSKHWPLWLHEGLATAFETADRRRPFGPDRDFFQRRDAFLERLDAGTAFTVTQLLELKTLDALTESSTTAAYVDGCALVSWLTRVHRRRCAAFLDAIGRTDASGNPIDAAQAFRTHVGDAEKITRQWWADERRRR